MRLLLLAALLTELVFSASSALASPGPPRVVVEITPKAEARIDAQLTRRLISLELNDVELPLRPGEGVSPATVFFRVLVPSADRLHIELWDRGEFHGARRVSISGSTQLRARRIALGAAELARRLRQRWLTEQRRRDDEARLAAEQRAREQREKRVDGVSLEAGARVAAIGPADAVLVGPRLETALHPGPGARVGLAMSSLFGAAGFAAGAPSVRWLEVEVSPAQALRLAETTDLVLGASAAAAAVHVNGVAAVDDIRGEADTWSARAGAFAVLETKLATGAWLSLGPEAGFVLRPIPFVDEEGERVRLGGLWLGARAGLLLDPSP